MLELLKKTRSYRRFCENKSITADDVRAITSAVGLVPSAANLQRVRVVFVNDSLQNDRVFETLSFAAYLKDWKGPEIGERPAAYAILVAEREPDVNLAMDIGLAAEAMILVARERGIGACLFRSFRAEEISDIIDKPGYYPALVIAFGYPAEEVVIEPVTDGNIKYWRDESGVHHVPKLSVDEILL